MYIDPHVHFRDGHPEYPETDQSHKETIEHGLKVAERAGLTAVIDMPNPDPPVITRKIAEYRISKANSVGSKTRYYLYGGLTQDPEQIRHIVQAQRELGQCVALKMFCDHSTGDLGIVEEEHQYIVMETLARLNYTGVLVQHHETNELNTNYFDPEKPISHAFARPFYSEVESLKRMLRMASEVRFNGHLHMAHISVPEAAQIVYDEIQEGRRISSGVCPHHILFDMYAMQQEGGIKLKMNPPLRPKGMNEELLRMLRDGKIALLETDHAPHTLEEKTKGQSKSGRRVYPSGVPGIHIYPLMINWLKQREFSEQRIREISFDEANRIFDLGLEPRTCEPKLDLFDEYESDVYKNSGVFNQK